LLAALLLLGVRVAAGGGCCCRLLLLLVRTGAAGAGTGGGAAAGAAACKQQEEDVAWQWSDDSSCTQTFTTKCLECETSSAGAEFGQLPWGMQLKDHPYSVVISELFLPCLHVRKAALLNRVSPQLQQQ
jgi:hypothetical protein